MCLKQENMDVAFETEERKTQVATDEKQLYTVEEVFDRIDRKFIDFYGEYGRKIVNTRREEWNPDGVAEFKKL
jgi:acetyl-CoA carboxylase carboxyltransferase component